MPRTEANYFFLLISQAFGGYQKRQSQLLSDLLVYK